MARGVVRPGQDWRYTIMRVEAATLSALVSGASTVPVRGRRHGPSEYVALTLSGPLVLTPAPKWGRGEITLHRLNDNDESRDGLVTEWIGTACWDAKNGLMRADAWIAPGAFQAVLGPCLDRHLSYALLWGPPMKYRKSSIKSIELEHDVRLEDY